MCYIPLLGSSLGRVEQSSAAPVLSEPQDWCIWRGDHPSPYPSFRYSLTSQQVRIPLPSCPCLSSWVYFLDPEFNFMILFLLAFQCEFRETVSHEFWSSSVLLDSILRLSRIGISTVCYCCRHYMRVLGHKRRSHCCLTSTLPTEESPPTQSLVLVS